MQQPSPDRLFAEIEASTAILAGIISDYDPGLAIPTCPDWTLRTLATHVGRVHRWAAEIVSTRTVEGIPFKAAPDGIAPADPAAQADWLLAGSRRVIDAIKAAGAEPVWAFGAIAPATFWARRQAHETMVHRVDAELAAGRDVVIDSGLAADAIDEWLEVMSGPRYGRPDARIAALPAGAALHVHATGLHGSAAPGSAVAGAATDGTGEWLISHAGEAILVRQAHADADVTVAGPADRLLLVLVRRLPPSTTGVTVSGNAALLTAWLEGTPF